MHPFGVLRCISMGNLSADTTSCQYKSVRSIESNIAQLMGLNWSDDDC